MKLFKKLLPVTTLASAIAIVTPLATSCSSGLASTSKFNYTPSAIHPKASIKLSETEKVKAMKEAYFKDTATIAQDIVYAKAQNYKEAKEALVKVDKDATFEFSATIKSFNIKETKEVEVTVDGVTKTLTGYVFDYETEYNRKYSYTVKDLTIEGVKYNQIKYTSEAHENDIAKNAFAFLWFNGSKLSMHCALLDVVSEKWLWEDHEKGTTTIDWTYSNGKTVTDVYQTKGNQYYSKETGLIPASRYWDMYNEYQYIVKGIRVVGNTLVIDYDLINTNSGSYYLSDITFDWEH